MESPAASPSYGPRAVFAMAAFGLAIGVVFALERVGAPDRLVAALGPVAAVIGVVALGALARSRDLLNFFVARRAIPPFYAGLALAATLGGLALAFNGLAPGAPAPPWRGFCVGALLAVFLVAPRWRAAQASAVADVLATRYPAPPARLVFALVAAACGVSLAAAGLGYAALSVRDAFGLSGGAAIGLCAALLVITLAPGGLRGLIWTDAASAGAGFLTLGLLVTLSALQGGPTGSDLSTAADALRTAPTAPLVNEFAMAAATASLFAFAAPALAGPTTGDARRAGLTAIVVLALGGLAAAALGDIKVRTPSDAALAALLAFLPAMALARAGLFAAARAVGVNLDRAHARLSVLASRRMAFVRGGVVVGAVLAAIVARQSQQPSAPLFASLAAWLAFGAPSLLLSLTPGRSSLPAFAALIVAAAAAVLAQEFGIAGDTFGPDLLAGALGAGLAGAAAGLAVWALSPASAPAHPRFDPFVELPLDV